MVFYEGKFSCPECGYILNKGDYFVLKPNGYVVQKICTVCYTKQYFEVSVVDVRQILKKIGHSKYYDYTTYFYKELTGDKPPNIPEEFLMKAKCIFQNFIETREKIRLEYSFSRRNNPPYLYLMYKIFDIILPREDEVNRRILQFINLPKKKQIRDKEFDIVLKFKSSNMET